MKEATVLNRVVRWSEQGLEYEADPRQGGKLLEELGLGGESSVVTVPCGKVQAPQLSADTPLLISEHTGFRAHATRANYLAADRPECQFAAKEVCRDVANPTKLSQCALKRLGRYLRGRPRLVFQYPYQSASTLDVYSDTDWAGCVRSRKSTSGGCLVWGYII